MTTKPLSLLFIWKMYLRLHAEGNKLCAESGKLYAEGNKLYAEGGKLYAEGNRLYAEGDKLHAEGNRLRAESGKLYAEGNRLRAEGQILWANAIIEVHGNIKLEWKAWNYCVLETGEEFKEEK